MQPRRHENTKTFNNIDYSSSALDDEALLQQDRTNPIAEIPLELDRAFQDGAAGAASALQLLT